MNSNIIIWREIIKFQWNFFNEILLHLTPFIIINISEILIHTEQVISSGAMIISIFFEALLNIFLGKT
jgi:hypothetical protein